MTSVLRRLLVLLIILLLWQRSLGAQVSGPWSACHSDTLSTYNCARYYSGTVSASSQLKGRDFSQTHSIVATVTAGRVTCRVKGSETPEFEAPGLLAVEHATTGPAGEYAINVWCPEAPGEPLTREDAPVIPIMNQRAADYALLTGKDEHEAADADAANGVTGVETITWNLRRQ
jgi:hypothetical protein